MAAHGPGSGWTVERGGDPRAHNRQEGSIQPSSPGRPQSPTFAPRLLARIPRFAPAGRPPCWRRPRLPQPFSQVRHDLRSLDGTLFTPHTNLPGLATTPLSQTRCIAAPWPHTFRSATVLPPPRRETKGRRGRKRTGHNGQKGGNKDDRGRRHGKAKGRDRTRGTKGTEQLDGDGRDGRDDGVRCASHVSGAGRALTSWLGLETRAGEMRSPGGGGGVSFTNNQHCRLVLNNHSTSNSYQSNLPSVALS